MHPTRLFSSWLTSLEGASIHRVQLAPLVERGVAFHYGNMPSLIRLEVERLFRSGKLRFLGLHVDT